jgi:hypothetical protein
MDGTSGVCMYMGYPEPNSSQIFHLAFFLVYSKSCSHLDQLSTYQSTKDLRPEDKGLAYESEDNESVDLKGCTK